MTIFALPAARLADAQARVSRFARKAVRLGMAAPSLTIVREFTRYWLVTREGNPVGPHSDDAPPVRKANDVIKTFVRSLDMVEVEITGERPIVAGWRFAAVIEATAAGNLLRKAPGFTDDLPVRFRSCTSECDHCKLDRNRSETFIVRSTSTGEYKQVGRTCLQDFVGAADPAVWIAAYQFLRTLDTLAGWDDGDGGFGGAQATVLTRDPPIRGCAGPHGDLEDHQSGRGLQGRRPRARRRDRR